MFQYPPHQCAPGPTSTGRNIGYRPVAARAVVRDINRPACRSGGLIEGAVAGVADVDPDGREAPARLQSHGSGLAGVVADVKVVAHVPGSADGRGSGVADDGIVPAARRTAGGPVTGGRPIARRGRRGDPSLLPPGRWRSQQENRRRGGEGEEPSGREMTKRAAWSGTWTILSAFWGRRLTTCNSPTGGEKGAECPYLTSGQQIRQAGGERK